MQLQVETQVYKKNAVKNGIIAASNTAHYFASNHESYGTRIYDLSSKDLNYIQLNSDDISMWRANKEKMRLDDGALKFFYYEENEDNIQHILASYGKDIKIYKIGTKTDENGNQIADDKAVIIINESGANIDGSVKIGGINQSEYLNKNIQIGGRNLLIGTKEAVELTTIADQNWFSPPLYELSSYANTAITDENNTTITISFDYSITNVDTAFNMTASLRTAADPSDTYGAGVKVAEIPVGDSHGHAIGTREITSAMRQYAPTKGVLISGSGDSNANVVLTISNVKLEFGNKATNWTPAPEDIDANQYIQLTDEGLNILYNGKSVALYGQTTRIGEEDGPAFYINDDALKAYNDEGKQYFEINANGIKFGNDLNTTYTTYATPEEVGAVKGNYTILWNYENFTSSKNGCAYICKLDGLTNTITNENGTVVWNGVNRIIAKQMINPNTVVPYNIPIYMVCKASSSAETACTNYMVWYNSTSKKWNYADCPTPSAVHSDDWNWANGINIIIGKFVETGSGEPLVEYEVFNPPRAFQQLTTNNITATSAATKATNYINFDTNNGLRIAQSTTDFSKPYVQITSVTTPGVITRYDATHYSWLGAEGLNIYSGSTNPIAFFGSEIKLASEGATVTIGNTSKYHTVLSDTALNFNNGANTTNKTLMSISGNTVTLYKTNTNTVAAKLDNNGLDIAQGHIKLGDYFEVSSTGSLTAKDGTIGGWKISEQNLKSSSGSVGLRGEGSADNDVVFWAGSSTPTAAPFRVTRDGGIVASKLQITGFAAESAEYSVEIEVKDIDYTTTKLNLVAHIYRLGAEQTIANELTGISYSWKKIKNGSTSDLSYTTKEINITSGADLEATYVCIISKS